MKHEFSQMKYVRFVRPNSLEVSNAREGFFCAAYELKHRDELDEYTSAYLKELLDWFGLNLKEPRKFSRSKSKGSQNKNAAGISWFKDSASDFISKSYELISLLQEHGYPIEALRTERVGYIIYEDENQVVAEPFSDTPV